LNSIAVGTNADVVEGDDGRSLHPRTQRMTRFWTTQIIRAPIVIDADVKTDTNELQLVFGPKGEVVFDWKDTHDLHFIDPRDGKATVFPDLGYIPPETFVHLRWTMDDQGSRIEVDGVQRVSIPGDFSKASGKVGVASFGGAVITVKSMTVTAASVDMPQGATTMPSGDSMQVTSFDQPPTHLNKLLATIKALYAVDPPVGDRIGSAEDVILTATPGAAADGAIPVTFTVPVDDQTHQVLDDVLRNVNLRYPHIDAMKFDISFGDKYTQHGTGSFGAACGTALLSELQNFDIDPKLAITGDVSADGKIRAVAGIAAEIPGATDAGCNIVAIPTDNYPQLCDAFVYDGPSLVTKVQIIGVTDLDDAVSVARTDRDANLAQAIEIFGDVQQILVNNPDMIKDKDVQNKLDQVLLLAPNHYSAKLLSLLAQNKQPQKMSVAASEYYTFLAMQPLGPTILQSEDPLKTTTPAVMEVGLKQLQKARWYADPQVFPFVEATQDFFQTVLAAAQGQVPMSDIDDKYQTVQSAAQKLGVNPDAMTKSLHDGI
jgi:hypothetical protein